MQKLQTIDIALLQQGDDNTFEQVYKAYFNALFFFAIQYVKKEAEAENLVQETYLALWVNKESFVGSRDNSVKAWLFNTIKNKCLNHLEKEACKHRYNDYHIYRYQTDITGLKQMQISELTFSEIEDLLNIALEMMPHQCRKVFEMSRFDGMRNKAIAKELDISVKAVESNITRALKSLRIYLKDYLPLCLFLGLFR